MVWTADQTKRIRSMWLDGQTAATIALELGVTRNAVIGKIDRIKLLRKPRVRKPRKPRNGNPNAKFQIGARVRTSDAYPYEKAMPRKIGTVVQFLDQPSYRAYMVLFDGSKYVAGLNEVFLELAPE